MSVKYSHDPEILALYARLSDLETRADGGELGVTPFLTPREVIYAKSYLSSRMRDGLAFFVGGYPQAERQRAVILPSYTEGLLPPCDGEDARLDRRLDEAGFDSLATEVRGLVIPLCVKGSGYRVLSHRDYLGSTLGLGLARDVLGDILVLDEHCAYLLCKGEILPFLTGHLTHVGSDPVKVTPLSPDTQLDVQKATRPIRDTVASPRLDCVVAALCNLSREKAQTAVRSGLVEVDYEVSENCDLTLTAPCVLSVRGVGKFSVTSFDGETRKGRLRLVAEKYV